MEYRLIKQLVKEERLRKSFSDLAARTFGLSFEDWYARGYWSEKYIPYAMVEGERVVANASVNVMDFIWQGTDRKYIQIGTVMTDPACRGRGLARRLIEEILSDWRKQADAVYLFANSSVLDFYPRFGFERATEYQYSLPVAPLPGDFRRLDMEQPGDRALLRRCYEASNPFSRLSVKNNYGLLMFYCSGFMKDCVYYSEKREAAVVAEQQGDALRCLDVFGGAGAALPDILNELAGEKTRRVVLGFSPQETEGCACEGIGNEEDTLFLYGQKENLFRENRLMFPLLSHA